ncbi:MAG: hypothetical protein WBR13_14120 [Allosphingosinicella sp.]
MSSEPASARLPAADVPGSVARGIRRVAQGYRIDPVELESCLAHLFLDAYAEVVLLRDGLEITIGGVGMRERLLGAADALHVPDSTKRLFAKVSSRFPDRIGYLKICLGPSASPPTMHCAVMAPWRELEAFLRQEPGFAEAAAEVAALRDPDSMCHMVGFTSLPGGGEPLMKVYWLLDQAGATEPSPMLAAARIAQGRVRPENKLYWMGVDWADARIDARWSGLADVAKAEFPDDTFLCISHLRSEGEILEMKLYLFVQDSRVGPGQRRTSLNLYHAAGLQYLHWQDVERAAASFSNAVAFQPDHAHAINDLGYCKLLQGNITGALADFERAIALDPSLSRANRDHARALLASGGESRE